MSTLKREPTLSDLILNDHQEDLIPNLFPDGFLRKTLGDLMLAKRFVLDSNATRYLAETVRDNPELIANAQDFAIPPYNLMWIEFPYRIFYETITDKVSDATADEKVGYLFHGPAVTVASAARRKTGELQPGILPIRYFLNRPFTLRQEMDLVSKAETSRAQLDPFFWGEAANKFMDEGKQELRALRENHSFELVHSDVMTTPQVFETVLHGSSGDLRNIIALLLFLNRTSDIQTNTKIGHAQRLIKRKPTPLLPHNVISFKLDPRPRFRKLTINDEPAYHVRRHDVRGHFCHDKKARFSGCLHGITQAGDASFWEEYKPLQWKCSNCGGHRWWRHEHERGTMENFVTKEYAVGR
jgi:hypothetical protein